MKKTITGWMPKAVLVDKAQYTFSTNRIWPSDIEVSITYDDGKPQTKTVYEWMWLSIDGWVISDVLLTEDEALARSQGRPLKKLREFQIEVDE